MAYSKQFPASTRRTFLKGAGLVSAAAVTGSFPMPAIAQAQDVTIISSENNGAALDALKSIAAGFGKEAGVNVVVNNMDHEAHKTAIRNYLVAGAPDICFWFSGNRMRAFVKRGLFDDISDLF
ncbi:twin-arginine translocation signal domain-containing protein, partial [Rhizobium phaseoli]